jgi:RND family efflux transporter MFP subunit
MSKTSKWIAVAVGVLVLGGGIGRAIVHKKAQQNDLAQSAASTQAPQMALTSQDVLIVQSTLLTRSIAVSGSLTAQRSAVVKAKVAAELQSLNVREGDQIKTDQIIGKLDSQEFDSKLQQARQQAASSKAQWQIAQRNLENNHALVQQGFISRNALDTSSSSAAASKATYEAALAAVDLANKALRDSTVRAPISGQISQRFVQAGERVAVDGRIVEIIDLSSLEMQAPLSSQDVTQIRMGDQANLHIEGLADTLTARIERINPSATADTRSVMVYLNMTPHPALRQGLFAQGEIMLAQRDALAVPVSAITRESGRDQVLRISQGKVGKINVKLGALHGKSPNGQAMQEVIEGVQAGDVIVRNATGTVRDGQAVKLEATTPAKH